MASSTGENGLVYFGQAMLGAVQAGKVAVGAMEAWVSKNYILNQKVSYLGNSYRCIAPTTSSQNPTDTSFWALSADIKVAHLDAPGGAENDEGSWAIISEGTATLSQAGTLEFNSAFSTPYIEYELRCELTSALGNTRLQMQYHASGNPGVWITAISSYSAVAYVLENGTETDQTVGTPAFLRLPWVDADAGSSGFMRVIFGNPEVAGGGHQRGIGCAYQPGSNLHKIWKSAGDMNTTGGGDPAAGGFRIIEAGSAGSATLVIKYRLVGRN